ncbi:MAG: CoB--CoM heterodisulfide reductase iron-sulfur subunit B family protein [Candidatus Thorarchaeota archaeon]|jgi:heterodisulfide reductase subunit B
MSKKKATKKSKKSKKKEEDAKEETKGKKYAFYIGCLTPARETAYETSFRRVFKELGVELVEMKGVNCCGLPIDPIDHDMAMSLATRNLTIGEDMGLDIITLCSGCAGTLTKAHKHLKEDREERERINNYLKEIGREFKGTVEAKHMIKVLVEDIGLERIKKHIKNPLKGVKIAEHYGCHVLRPAEVLQFDNEDNPTILRRLIELTGAEPVRYEGEDDCCGSVIIGVDKDISFNLVKNKLVHVMEAGADAMVTICPSCHFQFDQNQPMIEKMFAEEYGIPVLHYPQLLGLAMGIPPEELALDDLKVDADMVVAKAIAVGEV